MTGKNKRAGAVAVTTTPANQRVSRPSKTIIQPCEALGEIYRYILGPDWGSKREGELWTDLAEIEAVEAGYKP